MTKALDMQKRASKPGKSSGKTRTAEPQMAEPYMSLTEKAYLELEEMIVTLKLPPGATLSEAGLSMTLGIGRTPIREALHRLAREKLVVVLPQRGILVTEINVGAQLKLLEVRRELERLAAKSAARRATEAELQKFREIAQGLDCAAKVDDAMKFMRLDREFNQLLEIAARNEFLTSVMGVIGPLSRRFWYIHYQRVADVSLTARLHADMARAIANRDEAASQKASDALLDYVEAFTRATLDAWL
jgi:DNA-binding GntR family transcriptional regulator